MFKYWQAADMPSLTGSDVLVTGAGSGIGLAVSHALAAQGAHVFLGCRDAERAARTAATLRREIPGARVSALPIDLADLASIATATAEIERHAHKLDLLVNNAGVFVASRQSTRDGFELHIGVNHLAHFALTLRLHGLLAQAARPRVVNVTSLLHHAARIDFDDIHAETSYRSWRAYARSKLANILFTLGIEARFAAGNSRLRAVSAHPGYAATGLLRGMPALPGNSAPLGARPQRAALPVLRAAVSNNIPSRKYFGPRFGLRGPPALQRPGAHALDAAVAARLWGLSCELTGVRD